MQASRQIACVSYILFATLIFLFFRLVIYLRYFRKDVHLKQFISTLFIGAKYDADVIFSIFSPAIVLSFLPIHYMDNINVISTLTIIWTTLLFTVSLILYCDFIYFRHSQRHLTTSDLRHIKTEWLVILRSIFQQSVSNIVYTIIFLLFELLIYNAFSSLTSPAINIHISKELSSLSFFFVVGSLIIYLRAGPNRRNAVASIEAFKYGNRNIAVLSINGIFSIIKNREIDISKCPVPPANCSKEAFRNLKQYIDLSNPTPLKRYPLWQVPNILQGFDYFPDRYEKILLLVIEGLSANILKVGNRSFNIVSKAVEAMPYFNDLTKDCMHYTRYLSNGQRSVDFLFTAMTSLPPLQSFPKIGFESDYSNIRLPFFPELLKNSGFRTLFFSGAWGRSVYTESIAKMSGFQQVIDGKKINGMFKKKQKQRYSILGAWDHDLFKIAYEMLCKTEPPWFSTIYTATSHYPYAVPSQKYEVFGKANMYSKYLNTLHYTDTYLKIFLEKMFDDPRLKDTIVLIVGDHTDFAGEFSSDPILLFHVPFLIRYPYKKFKGCNHTIYSHSDLSLTLLELSGCQLPRSHVGKSMVKKNRKYSTSICVEGNFIHVTDGSHWIIINSPSINEVDSFKITHDFKAKRAEMDTNGLERAKKLWDVTRVYCDTIQKLTISNRLVPPAQETAFDSANIFQKTNII